MEEGTPAPQLERGEVYGVVYVADSDLDALGEAGPGVLRRRALARMTRDADGEEPRNDPGRRSCVKTRRQRQRQAGTLIRKQARREMPLLQFPDDALGVAKDACANLHDRGFSIAAGQRRQIRFRHDHGNLY